MGKNKLQRFEETAGFPHFFQLPYHEVIKGFQLKGKWNQDFFKNSNPITLELGCGKGEYTVGLARENPKRNYIGVDIKGARMWRGAKTALEEGLPNVAFLRTRIQLIPYYFATKEVSEIWITFPDPQLKDSRARKRLTHPAFLDRYRQFLTPDHRIHLKTDNPELYHFTDDVIRHNAFQVHYKTNDLYASDHSGAASRFRTFYEQMWLEQGLKIHYLEFSIDLDKKPAVPPEHIKLSKA